MNAPSPAAAPPAPLLDVRNLGVTLFRGGGAFRVIEDLSFSLAPGETLGIVGESGCGKSLTAQAILRLIPPSLGRIDAASSIRFQGEELTALSPRAMRHIRGNRAALILQDAMTTLNPTAPIGRQLTETLYAHQERGGITRADARARAVDALRAVGIPSPEERFRDYPHQLSGGMKQRVNIAIALLCSPELLIADEPTTALDVTIQAQILALLREAAERSRASVIIITHDMGVVASMADRVLVMYAGRLVEYAECRALFAEPLHPYTRGLLASIPSIERPADVLPVIPGQVSAPEERLTGCRFRPRCPLAADGCREEPPVTERGTRRVRCWRAV